MYLCPTARHYGTFDLLVREELGNSFMIHAVGWFFYRVLWSNPEGPPKS